MLFLFVVFLLYGTVVLVRYLRSPQRKMRLAVKKMPVTRAADARPGDVVLARYEAAPQSDRMPDGSYRSNAGAYRLVLVAPPGGQLLLTDHKGTTGQLAWR